MRPTTFTCQWCKEEFPVVNATGPIPLYCTDSHRVMAYQLRAGIRRSKAGQAKPKV